MNVRSAFTLIELLVVIAIISILAVVVVLTVNPAAMLQQGRDSNRVSDINTLTHAFSLFQTDQATGGGAGYLGNASSVYVSLPDLTLSGAQTSTCSSLGLPILPPGYTYQCSSPESYRNVNGTGWMPVNFSSMTTGPPLGQLPVDPVNSSSTGLYYTYTTNGTQYEVTAILESQKYKLQYATNPIDPYFPEVIAQGNNLALSALWNPTGLVGWWPLTEGSGTMALDQSGNGYNGSWNGSTTNGSYYATGNAGSYAGNFNGSNNYVNVGNPSLVNLTGAGSVSAWINYAGPGTGNGVIAIKQNTTGSTGASFGLSVLAGSSKVSFSLATVNTSWSDYPGNTVLNTTGWYHVVGTYQSGNVSVYINGLLDKSYSTPTGNFATSSGNFLVGHEDSWFNEDFKGQIDDVRLYNRALSPAEIQALYNAEK